MRSSCLLHTDTWNPLQFVITTRWKSRWVCKSRRFIRWQRRPYATLTPDEKKPYYVTTPIFYVNASPHVGHMYTMLLADVLKRWQALKGRQALLCTGTDEHGMKIQQAAAKADSELKAFCDKGAGVFKDLAGKIGLDHDYFIRTTDKKHKEAVEYAWQMLEERGHIYESKHEGWYSVSDETFYPQSGVHFILDPPTGRKIMASIETGQEVEWTSERNYHFRLSAFRDQLLQWYGKKPDWIVPATRMRDVVQSVTSNLGDLSISRPVERLTWGIRVPNDPSQTMYVWLDALLNYTSAAGYPFTPGAEHLGGWPADVQVIGKDIVRFHCIYWPALLMALDLPLPKQILTHGHWTLGRQKMAKSTGNVVNPFWALDRFGTDVMRYYLIHDGSIAQDADYENKYIVERYKKGLQGGLGNLASRLMRGKGWDIRRAVKRYAALPATTTKIHENGHTGRWITYPPIFQDGDHAARQQYGRLRVLPLHVDETMATLNPGKALQKIMDAVFNANAYLQQTSPWTMVTRLQSVVADTTGQEMHELSKQNLSPEDLEAEIDRVIYLSAERLRLVGIMLQAFMPESAGRLLDMLGVALEKRSWEWAEVGIDDAYGTPLVGSGQRSNGILFPQLACED